MSKELCIKNDKNSIVNVNKLIMEVKGDFNNIKKDNKPFEEKYPNLTVDKLQHLPCILDTIINDIKYIEPHSVCYEDDEGRNRCYIKDYYNEETFLKEDIFMEKKFLQEYLNKSNKKIDTNYLQETREEQIDRLLDNKEVFQALSLITNANTKEDIMDSIKKYNLDNLPLLQDNKKPLQITNGNVNIQKINENFNIYSTLLKLECPLFFSKELSNMSYTKPTYSLNRESKEDGIGYTIFSSDIYRIDLFKRDRNCWDECHIYIIGKKGVLVSNIGKCNYNDEINTTDIKDGLWHDFLNEFVGEVYSFDKIIKDFKEKRHDFHMNNLETYKDKYEKNVLKEIEDNFFETFISKEHKSNTTNTNIKSSIKKTFNDTIDIPNEVIKALNCFNIQISELNKLTQKRVNETFKELLKKYHPDLNKKSEENSEKTRLIVESKPILINFLKNKRKKV